jgi:hypothetical protein
VRPNYYSEINKCLIRKGYYNGYQELYIAPKNYNKEDKYFVNNILKENNIEKYVWGHGNLLIFFDCNLDVMKEYENIIIEITSYFEKTYSKKKG